MVYIPYNKKGLINMIEYIATNLRFLEGTKLECTFQDGKIFQYDVTKMMEIYHPLEELKINRELFVSGKLDFGGTVIVWNDQLDISTYNVYEDGIFVGEVETSLNNKIGVLLAAYIDELNITQTQLSKMSGINQGDISRIIYGKGNPTFKKVEKLFKAMGKTLEVSCK